MHDMFRSMVMLHYHTWCRKEKSDPTSYIQQRSSVMCRRVESYMICLEGCGSYMLCKIKHDLIFYIQKSDLTSYAYRRPNLR